MLKKIITGYFKHADKKASKYLPGLMLKIAEEYPESYPARFLLDDPYLCNGIFIDKEFQSRVMFPYFNIPSPITLKAQDFHDDFYPAFLKNCFETRFVSSKEELADISGGRDLEHCIIQEYIQPATSMASHIRMVVTPIYRGMFRREMSERYHLSNTEIDDLSIRAAVVLYNTNPEERRSNHKHGGKPIPLTGEGRLSEIPVEEERILEDLKINPADRHIPAEIVDYIYGQRDSEEQRLYDYLRLYPGFSYDVGLDIMFGKSALRPDEHPLWYMLEVQMGPDNGFLHESKAWIHEKRF
jgi:hypothetical protein